MSAKGGFHEQHSHRQNIDPQPLADAKLTYRLPRPKTAADAALS